MIRFRVLRGRAAVQVKAKKALLKQVKASAAEHEKRCCPAPWSAAAQPDPAAAVASPLLTMTLDEFERVCGAAGRLWLIFSRQA